MKLKPITTEKAVLSARQTSIELCRFTIPCSARIVTIDLSFMLVITSANTVNYELGYQLRKFKLMTSSKRVNSPKFYLQIALYKKKATKFGRFFISFDFKIFQRLR
jgi:hypothetical protein